MSLGSSTVRSMPGVERSARPLMTVGRRPHLPPGWPVYALFLGFPLWWVLGVSAFILPILAIPMLAWLFRQQRVIAPRGFGIWIAFILWMFGSVTQVQGSDKFIHYGYAAALYVAATILILFVFNISREALPTDRVIMVLAVFWMFVVFGGLLGVLLPNGSFSSPLEAVLPHRFGSNEFVHDLVHPGFAQVADILGYDESRPKAPFTYATNWGAAFGVLTPFVVLAWKQTRTRGWRLVLAATFLAGIVPVVSSLDRGLWLSLGAGLTYAAVRLAAAGKSRALRTTLVLIFTVIAVVYLTPLKTLVTDRFAHPHSNERRLSLYQESTDMVLQSPLFGFGTPQPSVVNPNAPPVGTQGQLWQVLVSHGIPGAALFVWWFVFQFWRLRRTTPEVVLWSHTVIIIALVQMPFYDSVGIPLAVIMIAIAIASRELPARTRSPVPSDARVA